MNSTRKIGLLLALVFLLPALFFSVYEISSLNKDEKMIQEIYSKQLEAILFSVNQYSDDILNSWISKIETHIQGPTVKDSIPVGIKELLTFNTSIISVFSYDTIQGEPAHRIFCLEDTVSNLLANVESSLLLNKDKIKQLIEYKKNGFRKMEALKLSGNRDILIFITEGSSKIHLAGLVIDPEIFISDLVGPRLQTIAKDQFVLSAFKKGVAVPVYSTFSGDTTRLVAEALTKSFWLFPEIGRAHV